MKSINAKKEKRNRRHARIRAKVFGTAEKPRLCVFKSNTNLYAQLIDDSAGVTLAASSTKGLPAKTLVERSKSAGLELAKKAVAKKITMVVFDRGGFIYTGRIKALADGAREGGLKF